MLMVLENKKDNVMNNDRDPKLVKILYVIPDGEEDAGAGEGLWAYSLGNQLYELQNIPVFAEHLNVEDIVRCEEPSDSIPIIRELVKPSGNRTLRVIFQPDTPDDICVDIMRELKQRNIFSEKVTHKQFMFNIPPESDFSWVRDFLKEKENEDILWLYE